MFRLIKRPMTTSVTYEEPIKTLTPHKIFLWDADGVYVDCAYPNPVHGHYGGGRAVRGAHVKDMLPLRASTRVLHGIQETLRTGKSGKIVIALKWKSVCYLVEVQFIPLHEYVLGLVTDRPCQRPCLSKMPSGFRSKDHRLKNEPTVPLFTVREWEVLYAYREGLTNRKIGEILGISERTVQFHFTNILLKLRMPSRKLLVTLDLTRFVRE